MLSDSYGLIECSFDIPAQSFLPQIQSYFANILKIFRRSSPEIFRSNSEKT